MAFIESWLAWIDENPASTIELVFAAVVAWTAVINMRLSSRLTNAELDPAITVYLEMDRERFSTIYLVIKNVGRGSARNLRLVASPDQLITPQYPEDRLSRMAIFRSGLAFMGPQQELRSALGTFISLTKDPIAVDVSYEPDVPVRWRRRVMRTSYILDVSQFEGISYIGEHPAHTSAKALKQIAGDLRHIKQGGSWANVSVTVKRRYFLSNTIDRIVSRWFGVRSLDREDTGWRYFRVEIRRFLLDLWRRRRAR